MTSSRPNFLFVFPDQWRWDWLGCENSPFGKVLVKTPNLDVLASRGVRFTQCRTNSPLCAPARASLVTGMRYARCGVLDNRQNLDPNSDTYLRRLRHVGYRVAATGKTDLQKHGGQKGLDGWTAAMGQLGFSECINQAGKWDAVHQGRISPADPYMASLHRAGLAEQLARDYDVRRDSRRAGLMDSSPSVLPIEHYTDAFAGRMALSLLDRWLPSENSPWHLWINFPSPHEPFDPPAEYLARYADVVFPSPVGEACCKSDHQAVRRAYAAMITYLDDWVGRLIDTLKSRGELERTIIIFSSDHGEMLGDHGRWFKAAPHEASIHVPLIISGPGIESGRVCDSPVELCDLSATMLDLAGISVPETWDAKSLVPLLAGRACTHRETTESALADWRTVCDGRWKLVLTQGKPPELFDLQSDPRESRNLARDYPQHVARLSM